MKKTKTKKKKKKKKTTTTNKQKNCVGVKHEPVCLGVRKKKHPQKYDNQIVFKLK